MTIAEKPSNNSDGNISSRKYVVEVDISSIDLAIEKANRLVLLLKEAVTIIDSLASSQKLEA